MAYTTDRTKVGHTYRWTNAYFVAWWMVGTVVRNDNNRYQPDGQVAVKVHAASPAAQQCGWDPDRPVCKGAFDAWPHEEVGPTIVWHYEEMTP